MTDLAKKPVKICDDRFLLKLTKDKMKAVLQLVDQDSSFNDVSFDEILQEAQDLGVSFGLVSKLPPARGDVTIVASGKQVIQGENAKVKPIVKPAIATSPKVKKLEQDRVDFRELGNIVNVPKGQLLLQKIAATDGTPGKNVLGEEVPAKPGKDVNIKCGPGALLSDDGMQVTSTLDGKFVMGDGKASVFEEHVVQGDVDLSTGNIAFCGTRIEISGQVPPGFKVKCKGDVVVGKGVNNAQVLAGGNITILGGLIGEDAEVRAKGDIKLDFCENTGALEARGSLTVTNFMVQVNVKTGKDLQALEGKGSLIGGKYVLGGSMFVNDLGSDAEVVTEVTVGLNPDLEQQKRKIEAAKEYWPNRMNEILKNINTLNEMKKKEGKDFSGEKAKILAELNKMMPEVMEKNSQLTEMETKLDEEINKAANELIYVYGTLYPGVHVTIGKASRVINKEEQQVVVELQKSTLTVHVRAMTPEEKAVVEM